MVTIPASQSTPTAMLEYAKPQLSTRDVKAIISAFETESFEMVATFVWTKADGFFHLGRISGAWRYEDSRDAREVGIHHVRPAKWLARPFGDDEVPTAVAETFARGGRNFQRTHDANAERRTAELWAAHS